MESSQSNFKIKNSEKFKNMIWDKNNPSEIKKQINEYAKAMATEYIISTQKKNEKDENSQIIELMNSLINQDDVQVKKLLQSYDSLENFFGTLTKELPDNIHKIEDMYLLNKIPTPTENNLKSQLDSLEQDSMKDSSNLKELNFSFHNKSVEDIVKNSKIYWNNLQLEKDELITSTNLTESFSKMLDDIKGLPNSWLNNMEIIKTCNSDKDKMKELIKNYTGEDYKYINKLLVNKNPSNLNKMSRYIHLYIHNYIHILAGEKYFRKESECLYRFTKIAKETLQLYTKDSIVFFTGLTSSSVKQIKDFGSIEFRIYLTSCYSWLKSGIRVDKISEYPGEEEILILPYILFKVTKVEKITEDKWIISLTELEEDKDLIKLILEPKEVKFKSESYSKSKFISLINEKNMQMKSELVYMNQKLSKMKQEFDFTIGEIVVDSGIPSDDIIDSLSSIDQVKYSQVFDKNNLKKVIDYKATTGLNYYQNEEFSLSEEQKNNNVDESIQNILWVDDLIFKNSDTSNFISLISQSNSKIKFVCKDNTKDGVEFLKSFTGKEFLKLNNFRILQDMSRLNEEDPYYAGVNFIKQIRNLGIQNKVMIFTSKVSPAEKKFNERNVSMTNVFISVCYSEVLQFINGS